jgi:hypothetical protein
MTAASVQKAMKDQPGTTAGGSTAMQNAKADDADKSLTGKAMEDQPGTMGGDTKNPTASLQTAASLTRP